MNKYKVTEQVTITIEVEASNEDEARMKAMATLPDYKTWELEASEGINVERIYDRLWYYKFEGKKFEYFEEVDACCEGDLSYLEGPFDTFLDAKAAAWKRFRRFSRATNLAERCARRPAAKTPTEPRGHRGFLYFNNTSKECITIIH